MARDIVRLSGEISPSSSSAQPWMGNGEPELADMLDDAALQAVMRRDGVTRQAVETLVRAFRRSGRARHSESGATDLPGICCRLSVRESEGVLQATGAKSG